MSDIDLDLAALDDLRRLMLEPSVFDRVRPPTWQEWAQAIAMLHSDVAPQGAVTTREDAPSRDRLSDPGTVNRSTVVFIKNMAPVIGVSQATFCVPDRHASAISYSGFSPSQRMCNCPVFQGPHIYKPRTRS